MKQMDYESRDLAGKLVSRPSTAESRQRAVQARYRSDPEATVRRASLKPYLARGAAVRLIPWYTGVKEELIEPARVWLRAHQEIPKKISAEARSVSHYDGTRLRAGMTQEMADMIQLGKQLVEKDVIQPDLQIWEQMLEEYKRQIGGFLPPAGFPERLILEGYLISRVRNRQKLEQALRDQLGRGALMVKFDNQFDFLNTVASKIKP